MSTFGSLLWVLASSISAATAQFSCLETEDLRLVYLEPSLTYLAPYAARCFETSMRFHSSLFSYAPDEKVTVLLVDPSDYGRASASAVPRDNLIINVAPVNFAYETLAPNERLNTIMNHELVHVVTMDQAARSDRWARRFFRGKVLPTPDHPETIGYLYLTTPRIAVPSWYQEGIAVFLETWMAGGIGRAQGAYDEMVFRSMVRDGTPFYDPLGLVSEGTKVDFQVGVNSYLYGTRFLSYLAFRHGPESLLRWTSRIEGTERYYASQFRQVYGLSLENAWSDWIAWEQEFQRENLAAIRQHPITPYRDVSSRALGSVSRAHFDPDQRKLYVAFNTPGVVAHVGAISVDDGSLERIVEVKDPVLYSVTSLAYDPGSRTLYYTTDNSAYRDLKAVDPVTKKARTLIKDARIGDLVFNRADRSIWGIRQLNGISTLVRIPPPYSEWKQVHSFPYGEVPYDLDISSEGTFLSASVGEVSGRHTLRVLKLESVLAGDVAPVAQVDFGSTIPSNFVFSPDGRYLYGSSYYSGVSNIFRYEIATRDLEAVSNCETGMFRPVPLGDDRLIVFRYGGEGFVPATIDAMPLKDVSAITFLGERIAETHPVVKTWTAGSPADVPLDSLVKRQGRYRSFGSVRLESIYPVVEGYKDSAAIGFSANFSDPIFWNRTTLTASYTPGGDLPAGERLHAHLKYQRHDWRANLKWNDADFYDLFGPTKKSRKGYSVGVGYKRTLLYDVPRELLLDVDTAYYGDLERLPAYQNVPATDDKLLATTVQLTYTNTRASLGAVDSEKGVKAEGYVGASRVHGDAIPFVLANLDVGFALPLRHSSIWLRGSAGVASGDRSDPFANFFFGGFGNNWVDQGSVKRYREFYSFPGVELNDIGGRSYVKTMLEWNLPPIRFRRVGTPGFYLTWARPALFATGIETNLGESSARRRVGNVGSQMDFRFSALSQLDLTLSFGYAVAFESGRDRRGEAMVSLKILR